LAEHEFLKKICKSDDFPILTISTLPYGQYGICEWEKGKTREMEIGKSKMVDNYRRLLENPKFTGNSPYWESHHGKNSSDTRDGRIMQKANLPMHSSAWQFRKIRPLPKFLVGDRFTSGLGT